MGTLTLPALASAIYLDTNSIIYSVEHVPPYHDLLLPIWQSAKNNTHSIVTSGLSLLETLVGPLKSGDIQLEADYRALLQGTSDVKLSPISEAVLEHAARLRATAALKTPDAIHAATARVEGCALLVTNDPVFRRVPGLTVVVLRDLLTP